MVVWQHSRWMFAKADCAKNLQIENQACLSTLVTTLLSDITFHLLPIWLQTLVAIVSESCLTLFPSFCTTIWSCCAVQFKSEQTPFPQTSCRFRPAALHHILLRDQRLIERLSELRKHWAIPWLARTCCIPSKFSREKSDLLQPEIYKALKPFWLLNWVRLARVVAYFHIFLERASRQLLLPQTLNCACQSYLCKQSQRAAPRAWQLILPSEPLITFWNRFWRDCQMSGKGSNSNLAWPTSCN